MGSYASLSLGASGAATYSGTLTPAGTTYRLGGGGGTLTFTPSLTGSRSLAVSGPGTVVLTRSNTYTGGTSVQVGILVASNGSTGSATGSGSVTLSGGTLASGSGGGSIQGAIAIGPLASEIAPGGVGSIGKLTLGSLLAASNLTTLNFDLTTPGGSGDLLVITGGLTLAPHTAITFGTNPTTPGDYRLIGYGSLTGGLGDFDLPARRRTSRTRCLPPWTQAISTSWPCPSPPPSCSWVSPPLDC